MRETDTTGRILDPRLTDNKRATRNGSVIMLLLVNHVHITNQTTHSIVPSKFKRLDCTRVVHEKTSCLVVFIRKSRVSKFSCHLHASYVYKTLMSGSENPKDFPYNSVSLQLYRPQN